MKKTWASAALLVLLATCDPPPDPEPEDSSTEPTDPAPDDPSPCGGWIIDC